MAEIVQMFLFLYKSKYRRKGQWRPRLTCGDVLVAAVHHHYHHSSSHSRHTDHRHCDRDRHQRSHGSGETTNVSWAPFLLWAALVCCLVHVGAAASSAPSSPTADTACDPDTCVNGDCVNGTCICRDGWQGEHCQFCGGKVSLSERSGSIHDGFGNYTADVKCSWLIESQPNTKIRMHIEQFATECGWDHLYIYDGDSVEAPLLAVFSGLMHENNYHVRRVPEVTAKSGSALLHFYSDVAYNMSGFNITYKINACPSNSSDTDCSGHGVCIDGTCTCNAWWTGEACDVEVCPNNCSKHLEQGECNPESHRCKCNREYRGADCSQRSDHGFWETVTYNGLAPNGSASHCSIVWKDSLYVVGGESFHRAKMIYFYDFNGNVWETAHVDGRAPLPRYAHSCVLFGDKIFVYGGVEQNSTVTNEIWAFDISTKVWENVTVHDDCHNKTICGPLKVAGHTATLVQTKNKKEKMVVIFGYSPQYGYLNTVQEYSLSTREWQIVQTSGFPVKGGYGHSAAYDTHTNLIYVYGGYVSESQSSNLLTSRLYSYDPNESRWRLLTSAPSARFFHTAAFVTGGLMLVFGGNMHNDTQESHGARCYSADTLGYDVTCDTWHHYTMPDMNDLPRYGHSATVFRNDSGVSMYIYGGFDGEMLSDMLRYTPGNCENITNQNQCLNARIGLKCVWHTREERCLHITKISHHEKEHDNEHDSSYMKCPPYDTPPRGMTSHEELCKLFTDCVACLQTSYNCVWCGKSCLHEKCRDHPNSPNSRPITELNNCDKNTGIECLQLHTCHACSSNPRCIWSWSNGPDRCKPHSKTREVSILNGTIQAQRLTVDTCRSPCVEYTSCRNCTESDCIWCQNESKCVDKNAYPASFPYGQCREWTAMDERCHATETGREWCSFYASCSACRSDPGCGWCDDGSGTGKGLCLPGGARGPSSRSSITCPSDQWYFTKCPICQCNGHSTCVPNTSLCMQPCKNNLTYGPHCDKCKPGYYGSPLNGGTCQPCSCNNQGTQCTSETGKCFCTTKGIIGDHCERCDVSGLYHGDPTNKGSCFYDLAIDYQFTFNLSKKEDRHYRAINFKNSPPKPEVDAEFSITCSVLAKMNVTIKKANSPEIPLLLAANCTTSMYKQRFSKAEHNFGSEDNNTLTTFYVYVYDFQPPLWIQISFSQYSKLNLQQFFVTFCTCFLALLLVAAIIWKLKQRYDMYRRRQRLFLEMEQMASRAFSRVLVEIERRDIENSESDNDLTDCSKNKKNIPPSPIALEPCSGNRAAVISLLVRLPTGGEPYTPAGQSAGLAVASALVTLGSQRKPSLELATKEPKKSRKSVCQHPDSTCI
ncbi:attractin-like protein 1 isoform X2 [Pseudomyrmex gracilis]|uniref:attractin-like protein 1 isoform X2 n=1 Tax=Pseudomyrmex gracilis TaxID=219809 RepID=UPI000994EC58|nr:attractin-like protein 1 isoform X2 [Pseudomyrmex gracilis]